MKVIFAAITVLSLLVGAKGVTSNSIDHDPGINLFVTPADVEPAAFSLNVQDEPLFSTQMQLRHIEIGSTWDTYRGSGVTVAVIDSGINTSHLDFLLNGTTTISDKSASFEEQNQTGYGESNVTTETVAELGLSVIEDEDGHGTNVAGTIAAAINGVGTAGVAPEVEIMVLKTNYYFTEIEKAIRYAADQGADIVNMSFTAYVNSVSYGGITQEGVGEIAETYFESAFAYAHDKGMTLVAASGNSHTSEKAYPAANTYVIGVGALAYDSSTTIATYSNYGLHNVDLVAPGTVYVPAIGSSTSYVTTQGTSFAAPVVAGALALYKEKYPTSTPDQQEAALKSRSYDLGATGADDVFGYGRLQIETLLDNDTIPVTGVTLSDHELELNVGETHTISATISPSNATNPHHLFLSLNEEVATVEEESGLITAVAPGTTQIGVLTDDGSYEDYCTVTVASSTPTISVTSVNLSTNNLSLAINQTETVTATILPVDATDTSLTWSSSDETVATVSNNGAISAHSAGSATIRATSNSDPTIFGSVIVTVRDDAAPSEERTWNLVSSDQDLAIGDLVIIASKTTDYAMSTTQNNNNRGRTSITKNASTLVSPSESVEVLTLVAGSIEGTFALKTSAGLYLYAASSSSNYLRSKATIDANASWLISIASGTTSIIAQGNYSRNNLRYNSTSSLFSCYASGQLEVEVYRLSHSTQYENLLLDITAADTCQDYALATDYQNRYLALASDEQFAFDHAVISDHDQSGQEVSLTAREKLDYMLVLVSQNQDEIQAANRYFDHLDRPLSGWIIMLGSFLLAMVLIFMRYKKHPSVR